MKYQLYVDDIKEKEFKNIYPAVKLAKKIYDAHESDKAFRISCIFPSGSVEEIILKEDFLKTF